jgi:CRP-like cAMP-binding protein
MTGFNLYINMTGFRDFVRRYSLISDSEWELVGQAFQRRVFKRHEIILKEGEICRYFFFLETGLLRYYYNVDGNEVVKTFAFPPFCFTSEASFINQRQALENIQALEESQVWITDYDNYLKLQKLDGWKRFTNGLLNDIDNFQKQMIIQLKSNTPEQRYLWLIQNFPQSILQQIPQKDMASYLGCTPQSLCRIKNRLR